MPLFQIKKSMAWLLIAVFCVSFPACIPKAQSNFPIMNPASTPQEISVEMIATFPWSGAEGIGDFVGQSVQISGLRAPNGYRGTDWVRFPPALKLNAKQEPALLLPNGEFLIWRKGGIVRDSIPKSDQQDWRIVDWSVLASDQLAVVTKHHSPQSDAESQEYKVAVYAKHREIWHRRWSVPKADASDKLDTRVQVLEVGGSIFLIQSANQIVLQELDESEGKLIAENVLQGTLIGEACATENGIAILRDQEAAQAQDAIQVFPKAAGEFLIESTGFQKETKGLLGLDSDANWYYLDHGNCKIWNRRMTMPNPNWPTSILLSAEHENVAFYQTPDAWKIETHSTKGKSTLQIDASELRQLTQEADAWSMVSIQGDQLTFSAHSRKLQRNIFWNYSTTKQAFDPQFHFLEDQRELWVTQPVWKWKVFSDGSVLVPVAGPQGLCAFRVNKGQND